MQLHYSSFKYHGSIYKNNTDMWDILINIIDIQVIFKFAYMAQLKNRNDIN